MKHTSMKIVKTVTLLILLLLALLAVGVSRELLRHERQANACLMTRLAGERHLHGLNYAQYSLLDGIMYFFWRDWRHPIGIDCPGGNTGIEG